MKKVNIHIVSHAAQMQGDLAEVERFFRMLNDLYLDKGLYFLPIVHEGTAGAACCADKAAGGDIVLFLFCADVDDGSQEALCGVLESVKKNAALKTIVYMQAGASPQADKAARLIDRINQEVGCYCGTYSHTDTLLLGILMQLRMMVPEAAGIRLDDGKVWQGSAALLSLEHVEMFSGHRELQQLKWDLAELEEKHSFAKARFLGSPDDNAAYERFFDLSGQRSGILARIRLMEANLYRLMEDMYEQVSRGELSARQAEGYQLIGRGEFQRAKEVLDYSAILQESRANDSIADKAAKRAQAYVHELLQLKETLESLADWQGVESCYREAVRLEERHALPKKAMLAYTKFLFEQSRQNESVVLAERLLYDYRNPAGGVSDIALGQLYKLSGRIYYHLQRLQDAEAMYDKAIAIFSQSAPHDADSADLLDCHDQLGELLRETTRFAEAEAVYKSAQDILKRLAVLNPDVYEPLMAKNFLSLGVLYKNTRRLDEAESMFRSALDIRLKLSLRNPDAFEQELAKNYNHLADLLYDAERMDESEEMYKPALEILLRLAGRNPEAFEPHLASAYNSLGLLYWNTERYDEAEKMHLSALEIRKRLVGRNPEAYEKVLANSYNSLGAVYFSTRSFAEAEAVFRASLDIRLRLSERNPGVYEPYVSDAYSNLGSIYQEVGRFEEAEEMFLATQKLLKTLAVGSPEAFEPDLADNYYNLGNLYRAMLRIAEAENAGRTALRLYTKYAENNPYCAKLAAETRELLESLYGMQDSRMKGSLLAAETDGRFTPEEREVALLLMEGDTPRDISRKLRITSAEVSQRYKAIREKVGGMGDPDPVNSAIIQAYRLTRREADMLHCLRRGMTNAEIAGELYLSEETVKIHIRNLLKKLPVENRQDISVWAEKLMERRAEDNA